MTTYVFRPDHPEADEFGMVDKSCVWDAPPQAFAAISDHLPAVLEHHGYADGRRTDSKSTFRRWTREAGLVEIGTEKQRPAKRQDTGHAGREVRQAIEMLRSGYKPRTMPADFSGDGSGWH